MLGQAGGWVKGTPEYIAPARTYMLWCVMGGYISSAALYFAAIPAIKNDIAKREALVRAGGSPQVCTSCSKYHVGFEDSDVMKEKGDLSST